MRKGSKVPYKPRPKRIIKDGMINCTKCGDFKIFDDFVKCKNQKSGLSSWCKECQYKKRTKETKENGLLWSLNRYYGMTLEKYYELLKAQNGVCAICGKAETRTRKGVLQRLSVDHDHTTGKIRGLLCSLCNVAIGRFEDNPDFLRKAMDYLLSQR